MIQCVYYTGSVFDYYVFPEWANYLGILMSLSLFLPFLVTTLLDLKTSGADFAKVRKDNPIFRYEKKKCLIMEGWNYGKEGAKMIIYTNLSFSILDIFGQELCKAS